MFVINQPWGGRGQRMGDIIVQLLGEDEPRFETFRVCVAFVKAGGILHLAPALQAFVARGGRIEIVAGIDEGITTRQALELVIKYSTMAYVFHNPVATFHPKVYLFEAPSKQAIAFIGSSNLTSGGLYTNYEVNLGLEFDLTVAADQAMYGSILAIFLNAIDVTAGNAKRLDATMLDKLVRARKLGDETRPTISRRHPRRPAASEILLFPRTSVLPAPRVDPGLAALIPRVRLTGDAEVDQEAMTALQPSETFVMILGQRDTRQIVGYSRDVYIPLAARDFHPQFWGWPAQFKVGSDTTVGKYQERRIDMLVRPATGPVQVVENVRLYYYDIKDEFRLNCSRLIAGACSGDLLVVQKPPVGTVFEGRTYEFEAAVIPSRHPAYEAFVKECRSQVSGSPKRWGYS